VDNVENNVVDNVANDLVMRAACRESGGFRRFPLGLHQPLERGL
jgi:hypothetical protein